MTVDVFTISWHGCFFYAFPPFSIVLRVIQKIIKDKAEGILVVPHWPTQVWFPLFNKILIGSTVVFKPSLNLLNSPFRKTHPLASQLTLVAGRLLGKLFA